MKTIFDVASTGTPFQDHVVDFLIGSIHDVQEWSLSEKHWGIHAPVPIPYLVIEEDIPAAIEEEEDFDPDETIKPFFLMEEDKLKTLRPFPKQPEAISIEVK